MQLVINVPNYVKEQADDGKLHAKKASVKSRSKKYKIITEETDRRIDEAQRRYAEAYQRASTFLAK